MSNTTKIIHNPRCSKSRATLALLVQNNIDPEIIHYLDSPLDENQLKQIADMLDCSILDFVRKGEPKYKELDGANFDEAGMLKLVVDNPVLLERPIVIHNGRAAIGRPPENVLALFKS